MQKGLWLKLIQAEDGGFVDKLVDNLNWIGISTVFFTLCFIMLGKNLKK